MVRRMTRRPDPVTPAGPPPASDERVRSAIELLEALVADRSQIAQLRWEDRVRLLEAAGRVSRPDALVRRHVAKAARRERRRAKIAQEESILAETGIRKLRREIVFTTPNVFAPGGFAQ